MPLRKSAIAIRRKIEDAQRDQLERGLPAGAIRDQVSGANLPPGGNTGQGYTPDPDAVTRIDVRKNSIGTVLSRRRLNLIEGSGATITIADDGANEEIDITIAASGGGGALDIDDGVTTVTSVTDLTLVGATITDDTGGAATLTVTGGGGATVNTGADASKGTGTSGDLYLPNDAGVLYRSTGAAQIPWGPIYPLADPNAQTWAWINQGSSSVDSTNGGVLLLAPSTTGNSLRVRKKAAPSTPYTITALIQPGYFLQGIQGYGLCFRESSSGKIHTIGIQFSNPNDFAYHICSQWTDATTYSTEYSVYTGGTLVKTHGPLPLFIRIADNGTNRICSLSYDGFYFSVFHTIGRTNFLTADEVGWFVRDVNGQDTAARLLSWKEA